PASGGGGLGGGGGGGGGGGAGGSSPRVDLSRATIYYRVRDLPIPSSGAGGGRQSDAQRKGRGRCSASIGRCGRRLIGRGVRDVGGGSDVSRFSCVCISRRV